MSKITLKNGYLLHGNIPVPRESNLYYPRLQVNKLGEIVLALHKSEGGLTRGILVGKTENSNSKLEIGSKFSDWEVVGELKDYDGDVSTTFTNLCKTANSEVNC